MSMAQFHFVLIGTPVSPLLLVWNEFGTCIHVGLIFWYWCLRSGSWSLCCVSPVTPPGWYGHPQVMLVAQPSASTTFSTQLGRSLTAPLNTLQICSAWHSTNIRITRFVWHAYIVWGGGVLWCKCHLMLCLYHWKLQIHQLSLVQGLFSSVICPGLVMTNLTYGILPPFFWTLVMPIMWLVRVNVVMVFNFIFNKV